MDISHLSDVPEQHICVICGANWVISHAKYPPGVQSGLTLDMAYAPNEYAPGYSLLSQKSESGPDTYAVVEDARWYLGGLHHLRDHYRDTEAKDVLGLPGFFDGRKNGSELKGHFEFVLFVSADEIREKFHWTWKDYATNRQHFSREELLRIFALHFKGQA
jgi:hypothetical protein